MNLKLNQFQKTKISLIILFIAISVPLLLYNGTMDDFVPKHLASIQEISHFGKIVEVEDAIIQVPGFYILGAIITLLTGFGAEKLINFPIQLIPYAILIFSIVYKISGSTIVSGIITFIDLCSGSTGTPKTFFWPHGMGYILFFTILLIVILLLLKQDTYSKKLVLLGVITSSSLVFMSYNLTAMTIIFYGVIVLMSGFIIAIRYKYNKNIFLDHPSLKRFIFLVTILIIITLGLSQFVYKVFVPMLQFDPEFYISALDKFLIGYINPDISGTPFNTIMVHYPASVSIISAIKYGFLLLIIFIFILLVMKKIINKDPLNYIELFLLALLLMYGIYSIPRTLIGGIAIAAIFIPAIFCIGYFFRFSKKEKILAMTAVTIVLLCTVLNYCFFESNNLIDSDEHQFQTYKTPVTWFLRFGQGYPAVSDEYTKNLFILNSYNFLIQYGTSISSFPVKQQFQILPRKDVLVLIKISDEPLNEKYFIINKRLNTMSLQGWIIIQSWIYSIDKINNNVKVNKIYSTPLLDIYTSF